jgi:PPOX class probable F420-dependent enzyme
MWSDVERALLDSAAFATLSGVTPRGMPWSTIMWYRRTGDELRMISPRDAAKVRFLRRHPAAAVVVCTPENPYRFVEIRGLAHVVDDDAAARVELRHIAQRYIGGRASDYVAGLSSAPRVILTLHPKTTRYRPGEPTSSG